MDAERLKEIRERVEKASDGPWFNRQMEMLICPYCGEREASTIGYKEHYLAFGGNHQEQWYLYEYICGICGASFFSDYPAKGE